MFSIAAIFLVSALLAVFFLLSFGQKDAAVAVIEQDGHELMRLLVAKEQTVRIVSDGGVNVIVTTGSGVLVSEADCPDQICVRQGEISHSKESIICLPHRLIIRLEDKGHDGLDAMTN